MKFLKSLFLFGFILLHSKVGNNPIWFKIDYIVTVSKNTVYGGSTVRTINDSEGFVIKEDPDIIMDMIQKSDS